MRLLNSHSLAIEEYWDANIPPYAILSHTWDHEEVSFQDMQDISIAERRFGFSKLKKAADLAAEDGYDWIWIDTCCIDKTSSAELSEAINSMYTFYRKSQLCYCYLSDVDDSQNLSKEPGELQGLKSSRWFTRGWTLQEMIASPRLQFYSQNWTPLGDRQSHSRLLESITNVDRWILEGGDPLQLSIARKMFWASSRRTSRAEDASYCLFGLFDINMPLLYGEGAVKAFRRLQEEILKVSDDQTLFAWVHPSGAGPTNGLLANHPGFFKHSGEASPFPCNRTPRNLATMTPDGMKLTMLYAEFPYSDHSLCSTLLILDCCWGPAVGTAPAFEVTWSSKGNKYDGLLRRGRKIYSVNFSDPGGVADHCGMHRESGWPARSEQQSKYDAVYTRQAILPRLEALRSESLLFIPVPIDFKRHSIDNELMLGFRPTPIRLVLKLESCSLQDYYPSAFYDAKTQLVIFQERPAEHLNLPWRRFHGCFLFHTAETEFYVISGHDHGDRMWCIIMPSMGMRSPLHAIESFCESHKRRGVSLGSPRAVDFGLNVKAELQPVNVSGFDQCLLIIDYPTAADKRPVSMIRASQAVSIMPDSRPLSMIKGHTT